MRKILSFSLLALLLLIGTNAWADDIYVKVTSTSDVVVGGYYILADVSSTTAYAMGELTTGKNPRGTIISLSASGNVITVTSSDEPLVFELGGATDEYTLKEVSSTEFLSYKSGTTVEFVASVSDNKGKWTATYNASYGVLLYNKDEASRMFLRNSSSAISAYSNTNLGKSGYGSTVLYRKVATVTIGATGWTTFASSSALDLAKISASSGTATAHFITGVGEGVATVANATTAIPAGEGILINGSNGATVYIPVLASGGTALSGNKLVGRTTSLDIEADNPNIYVLVNNGSGTAVFKNLSAHGATIPAGKAYLDMGATPAPAVIRLVDDETGATNIWNVEETADKAVKFIENGKLYILRDGITYDALGRVVR